VLIFKWKPGKLLLWHKFLINTINKEELIMENNEKENRSGSGESTASDGNTPDVGAGPVADEAINSGGHGGAKQRKEHTGNDTAMGGGTGGTPGKGDASEGNSN
jgi:hypothetical protein